MSVCAGCKSCQLCREVFRASDPLKPGAEPSDEPFPGSLVGAESSNYQPHNDQTGILFDYSTLKHDIFHSNIFLHFLFFGLNYRYSDVQLFFHIICCCGGSSSASGETVPAFQCARASWNHLEACVFGVVSILVCHLYNWLNVAKLLAVELLKGLPDTFPPLRSLFVTVLIYSVCSRQL